MDEFKKLRGGTMIKNVRRRGFFKFHIDGKNGLFLNINYWGNFLRLFNFLKYKYVISAFFPNFATKSIFSRD